MKKVLLLSCSAFVVSCFSQPSSFTSRGPGGGGALFSPSFSPSNPNELYVACDMSELFHTTNLGTSWSTLPFQKIQGGNFSQVQFTNNALIQYCINYDQGLKTPCKSTDGGVNWAPLAGDPTSGDTWHLLADINNSNNVIVSNYNQLWFSGNGGTSFALKYTSSNVNGLHIGGAFFDNTNIYVGTNDGMLISLNSGTSFTISALTGVTNGNVILSFAGAKQTNTTRFFIVTAAAANVYNGIPGSDYWTTATGVYSMDYGLGNWVNKTSNLNLATDFPFYVAMAQNDISTAYLGGSNSGSVPTVFRTTNAGTTWSNAFTAAGNGNIITGWCGQGGDRGWSYEECAEGFAVSPVDKNKIVISGFGFVHISTDGGTSWNQRYVDPLDQHPAGSNTPPNMSYHSIGLENTTCWQVFWINNTNMYGAYSDIRAVRSNDAGLSWSFNYTGSTANSTYRLAKHSNGTLFAATSNIHDMYQSTRLQDAILDAADANGRIISSVDNGATWQQVHFFNHPVFWIALDPNNPNRAYASVIHYANGTGTGGVYRCDNLLNLSTSTWTLLPNPPNTEKHPASLVVLNDGKLVATYSGRRDGAGVFTPSSGVFIYDPNSNTWSNVTDNGMKYWTKDIVVDPNDALQNTWYVGVYSGWGGPPNGLGGLYRTTNRGTTWTKLTGSQFDRVESCTFNPNNANEIYLSTETQGLWMSGNINSMTPSFSLVSSYPFRQPERIFFNPYNSNEMWVSSFGHGMMVGSMTATGMAQAANAGTFRVYPNPSNGMMNLLTKEKGELKIYDSTGQEVYSEMIEPGEHRIDLKVPSGIYLLRCGNMAQKIVIQR